MKQDKAAEFAKAMLAALRGAIEREIKRVEDDDDISLCDVQNACISALSGLLVRTWVAKLMDHVPRESVVEKAVKAVVEGPWRRAAEVELAGLEKVKTPFMSFGKRGKA